MASKQIILYLLAHSGSRRTGINSFQYFSHLCLLMTHLPPNVWAFLHQQQVSQLSLQLASDTSIQFSLTPAVSTDLRGLRTQSPKTVLTSGSSHKYWVPRVPTLLSNWATVSGAPTAAFFSALVIGQSGSQNTEKSSLAQLQFIKMTQVQRRRGQGGGGAELPGLLREHRPPRAALRQPGPPNPSPRGFHGGLTA